MNTTPTTEERVWAVLSHLSALAFGMGILLPVIGWSEQRHKSEYASFQCLQALGYQSLGYTIWLLSYILIMILFVFVLFLVIGVAEANGAQTDAMSGIWSGIFVLFALGSFAIYMLFPILAAIACALGRDFRYPILGNRLAKYLGYDPGKTNDEAMWLIGEHEDRWTAAMGHFSVIIALWGLIAPATTWILQGRQSAFLKFQSVQTTLYQAVVNIIYLGAGVVYFLGIIILFAMMGLGGDPNLDSPAGIAGMVTFFISLIIAALIMLLLPLFHILGQWAGYRVLKGDNFSYPLIGRLVENWMAKS
jgi:uncharacterized Tic20 family protein